LAILKICRINKTKFVIKDGKKILKKCYSLKDAQNELVHNNDMLSCNDDINNIDLQKEVA